MKNYSLMIACFIAGHDYHAAKQYDSYSKRKIIILAVAMLVPTLIWTMNGYLLTCNVLGQPPWCGIIVGLLCGLLIFITEKLIVMSAGGWAVTMVRLVLALTMSALGSVAIKEVIFKKDIDNELARMREVKALKMKGDIKALHKDDINELQHQLADANKLYQAYNVDAIKESHGGYSKKIGFGTLTGGYLKQRDLVMQRSIMPTRARIDSLNHVIDNELKQKLHQMAANEGLWTRIEAFINITFRTVQGRIIFGLLFLMFFCLEIVVVLLKAGMPRSSLEDDERLLIPRINA